MKLVRKNTKQNVMQAVVQVSGYTEEELKDSRKHDVTDWVKLGIYVANQSGISIKDSAGLFGRHFATGHQSINKVKKNFYDVEEGITEIMKVKMKLEQSE